MQEVSLTELVGELEGGTARPFGAYQPHVKHVSDDRSTYILRFDNGYGALAKMPNRVTIIAWRPDASSIHEYYDVTETLVLAGDEFDRYFDIVTQWGPPAPF